MAATLQEAIDDVVRDIGIIGTSVPTVATRMMTRWLPQMFTNPALFPPPGQPWQRDNVLQRSVFDWANETLRANAEIQSLVVSGNAIQQANVAINVVARVLLAVQIALAAGRITAAQVTSTVTAYTNAWEAP